jgi:hypothetical protein
MGRDEYLTDLPAAYRVLVNYKTPENARQELDIQQPATAPRAVHSHSLSEPRHHQCLGTAVLSAQE